MFTGIIQDIGEVKSKTSKGDSLKFIVMPHSKNFLKGVKAGDSISINGACMTVEKKNKDEFEFTTIKESLNKTNFKYLELKDLVNIEKAMTLNSKLDGHIVQGHIDTTGQIKRITKRKNSREFFIRFSSEFSDNIINVGSIAVNGVSLTIAEIMNESSNNVLIKVAIIPHTFRATNFNRLKENEIVNIEFDMLGKYVKRVLLKK
jgi:riboflavin synthase